MRPILLLSLLLVLSIFLCRNAIANEQKSSNTLPEVWLCPPGPNHVLDLIAKGATPESSLKGISGLKLYIGLMKSATQSELEALAALVRKNKLKVIVEIGGTLNHDWQDQAGEKSAEVELAKLKRWYEAGGKVDYLDIDGPVWRLMGHPGWGKDPTKKFVSYDRCAKELMDYLSAVKKAYPEIQFFLLTNFPNWGYKKGVSYHASGPKRQNRGDYHEVVTAVMKALKESHISLAGATVDNPYGYFTGTHRSATLKDPTIVDWIARVRNYEEFCKKNGWEFNLIVNSEIGGKESDIGGRVRVAHGAPLFVKRGLRKYASKFYLASFCATVLCLAPHAFEFARSHGDACAVKTNI